MKKSLGILEKLRRGGFRKTPARAALIEVFETRAQPLSVSELLSALRSKRVAADKTTVYREIAFLLEQGIVAQVQFGDRIKRYELHDEKHHHHLVCTECGTVADIALDRDLVAVEKRILRRMGFAVTRHTLEFFGICADCSGKN